MLFKRSRNFPCGRNIAECDFRRNRALPFYVAQNLSKIEKCMLRIEFRPVRSGTVAEHLVLNTRSYVRASDPPSALVDLEYWERRAVGIRLLNPVHVLRKIAHLVRRVPDRQLQFALAFACR